MEDRKIIHEKIFEKHYDNTIGRFLFSDLPKDIKPTDEIYFENVESFYSDNESWEAYSILEVYRQRPETDSELVKRRVNEKRDNKFRRDRRYENYLKLKKEFENEESK